MSRSDVTRLAKAIDLIAKRCRNGIPALMGQSPHPTDTDIYEALSSHSADGPKVASAGSHDRVADEAIRKTMFDEALALVEWPALIRVVRKYARDPKTAPDWKAYQLHCLGQAFRGSRFTYATHADIAVETGMSKGRVARVLRRVPEQIAYLALTGAYIKLPLDKKV